MKTQTGSTMMRSPLKETGHIRPSGASTKKSVVVPIMLTSLVDIFTVLVIYLLVNSSGAEQVDVGEGIQLPNASHSTTIDQSPIVMFREKSFWIDDARVADADLQARLQQLRIKNEGLFASKDAAIIVQADKNTDFKELQPILIASAYAGIKQVKFAVVQGE